MAELGTEFKLIFLFTVSKLPELLRQFHWFFQSVSSLCCVSMKALDGCYHILGCQTNSKISEVKVAFKKKAYNLHPDRNEQ